MTEDDRAAALADIEAFIAASEREYIAEVCIDEPDDEPVAAGVYKPSEITFGHVRRARGAINLLVEARKVDEPRYIVWNAAKNEGVVFLDRDDAEWAQSTDPDDEYAYSRFHSTIGEAFVERYGEDERTIETTPQCAFPIITAIPPEAETIRKSFYAAIDFAISEGLEADTFLRCWNEGDWRAIAEEWPEFDLSTTGVDPELLANIVKDRGR